MRSSCVLLALLMCTAHPREDEPSGRPLAGEAAIHKNQPAMQVQFSHLTVNSTTGDVIAHPAFAGFGRSFRRTTVTLTAIRTCVKSTRYSRITAR